MRLDGLTFSEYNETHIWFMDDRNYEERFQNEKPRSGGRWMLPVSILAAGVLIAGSVIYSVGRNNLAAKNAGGNSGAQVGQVQQPAAQDADISKVEIEGNPFVGDPNAPITVAYWLDYQCPFCRRFETQSMPQLYEEYVKTGKVKLVYKDFQFLGPDSQTLGKFGRAVWEAAPDKFYAWHKAMYENQGQENTGWATQDVIMQLTAQAIGASDAAKALALVQGKGDRYQQLMDADKAEGSSFGVSGTPSFISGKQLLVGAQPYSAIKQFIDLTDKQS